MVAPYPRSWHAEHLCPACYRDFHWDTYRFCTHRDGGPAPCCDHLTPDKLHNRSHHAVLLIRMTEVRASVAGTDESNGSCLQSELQTRATAAQAYTINYGGDTVEHAHPIKKMAKLGLNQLQRFQAALGQGLGVIDFPVPPNSSMRKTSSRSMRHYYISGIQTVVPIVTCALQRGVALNGRIRILDFGCGVARQLLHFTRHYPNPSYYACDVDDSSIAFVQKAYPQVEAHVNPFHPPLKYPDGFFDLIYSVSIFSHLNVDDQKSWLAELARITKPGGYCFLTTEGRAALGHLTSTFGMDDAALARELAEQGIIYKEYDFLRDSIQKQNTFKVASLLVGIEGSYGNTVLAPQYIRSEWGDADFEVLDIIEGIIDYRQDLVILRRRR